MALTTSTGRGLRSMVRFSCAHPRVTLFVAVLLAAISVAYAARHLTFKTSQTDLLPRTSSVERYRQMERQFGDLDELVVVVQAPALPAAQAYAARLARELRSRDVPLERLAYRIDPRQFEGRILLYLSAEQLTVLRDKIFDAQQFMEAFARRPTLDQLVDGIATQLADAFAMGFLDLGLGDRTPPLDLRLLDDVLTQIASRLDTPAPYRSPFGAFFFSGGADDEGGYFLSDDRTLLFVLARSRRQEASFTRDRRAIDGIRQVIRELGGEFPSVSVGVTGRPALASDEMTAAFRDSERATLLAFALTLGLLGLRPDGDRETAGAVSDRGSPSVDDDWSFRAATRTRAFWLLMLAGASHSLISTALTFHHVSFMASRGLSAEVASAVFSVVAVTALAGTLTAGVLSDRFPVRHLLAAGQGLLLAAMLWSFTIAAPWAAVVYGALLGVSSGFSHTLQSVVWPAYFGRRHLGTIRSVTASSMIASAAIGPFPFGWLFDVTGSYGVPVAGFLALPIVAAIGAWAAARPRK